MSLTKDEQTFWARVKALAQNNLGQASYDFFIEPAKLLEITDHNAKIYLDNNMHRDFGKSKKISSKQPVLKYLAPKLAFPSIQQTTSTLLIMKMRIRLQKHLNFRKRTNLLPQK